MRDIKKAAEQGKALIEKNPGLDIFAGEMTELQQQFKKDIQACGVNNAVFNLITTAYTAGVAAGSRNA